MSADDRFRKADNSEVYVITACIMGPNSFYRAKGCGITAEHFFTHEHAQIFELIATRAETIKTWDFIALVDSAPKNLSAMMMDYAAQAYGNAAIEANCQVIIGAHTARGVNKAGVKIAQIQELGPAALAEAHAILSEISSGEVNEIRSMKEIIGEVHKGVNERFERGQQIFGLATGISDLDKMLGGLSPGLTIIGARPSMGKTAFALFLSANVAIKSNASASNFAPGGVFIASLEMGGEPLGRRLLAQIGGIPAGRLKTPSLLSEKENDWPKMTAAVSKLSKARIDVWPKAGVTADQVSGQMRRVAAKGGLSLCIVDYLQLLRLDRRQDVRHALGDACKTLRKASHETGVPVVLLAQLNRATDGAPQMKDLRDSGEIEQDADTIIFLHRESYYRPGGASSSGIVDLIVAKHRDGETGIVKQFWDSPLQRFCDPLPGHFAAEQREESTKKTQYQSNLGARKK